MEDSKPKTFLIATLFGILAIIVFGLIWFFLGTGAASPVGFGWYFFSFAAGLSMIVLPCTLPLAFVIVPLSMGKGPVKGFMIALAFGLGVAFTLSLYGVIAAIIGKVAIGTLGAPLEVVKNWLYFVAGIFAYIFALGELGLVRFRMPSYSGAFPAFIQKQQDVLKALLLGLFLGNIGVGCPHPATPMILTRIAVSGNVFYGWLLFFVHAVGRVLPLIFLAILGILGVNALQGLLKHKDKIERATGWGMVFVASFILVLGLFSHDWWVVSGQHTYLEEITQEESFLNIISAKLGAANAHHHGLPPAGNTGLFGLPLSLGTWVMLFLWILPLFWYYNKKKKEVSIMADSPDKETKKKTLPYLFWNFVTLSLLLTMVFGYALPTRFLNQASAQNHEDGHMMEGGMMMEDHEHAEGMDAHMEDMMAHEDDHGDHGGAHYHESDAVTEGLDVDLDIIPPEPKVGEVTDLIFFVNEKPQGTPVDGLEIEHEKYVHVIGVRDDLNEFFHIHPSPILDEDGKPLPGKWSVPYTFSKPGVYKVWNDVKHDGEGHSYGHPTFTVAGEGESSKKQITFGTNVMVDDYQVGIHYDEPIGVGQESGIHFTLKDVLGSPIEVEQYLGADMHLAAIKDDLGVYIHTHPGGAEHTHASLPSISRALAHGPGEAPALEEKEISFTVNFPETGIYKLFAQFRPKGIELPADEALTASFYVKVEEAKPVGISPWWRNLLVSIVLILLLSWGVKKYITVPIEAVKKP